MEKAVNLAPGNGPGAIEVMSNETTPALTRWIQGLEQFRSYELEASTEAAAHAHVGRCAAPRRLQIHR